MVKILRYFEGEDKIYFDKNKDYIISFLADGHGIRHHNMNDFCSSYICNNFHNLLLENGEINKLNIQKTVNKIEDNVKKNEITTGSTLIGFIIKDKILSFNIGDSKFLTFSKDKKLSDIFIDHDFKNKNEKKRFTKSEIESISLSMSRSIGDFDIKEKYPSVISKVEFKEFDKNNIKYLLLMSDGLFHSLSFDFIQKTLDKNSFKKSFNKILEEAKKNIDIDDDKSMIIIKL